MGMNGASSQSGGVNIPGDDPRRVRRTIIVGHPSLASFRRVSVRGRAA